MFAIIDIKGSQYKIKEGDKLKIAKISEDEGSIVKFGNVLIWAKSANEVAVGAPYVEAVVSCKVVSHGKGDKIRVVKMKKRKRYTRVQGHRQQYTELEIQKIEKGKISAADTKKAATKEKTIKKAPVKEESSKKTEANAEKKTEKKDDKKGEISL